MLIAKLGCTRVGTPQSSFLLLGRKFEKLNLIECSAMAFALIRERAEKRAFRNAGGLDSDTSLDNIYQEVGHVLGLSTEQCKFLQNIEKKHEKELLVPVPKALEILDKARRQKHKIIFISDMYMEHSFIAERLLMLGVSKPEEKLYLSKDYGSSKFTGRLYREVIYQEQVKEKDIIHCGNHSWSDVDSALKAGLRVSPFLEGNLNRYEQIMEDFSWMTEGLSSAMAGASRLTRLSSYKLSAKDEALREVAAGVAAPMLVGFTLWVLRRAQELGLERLYFLSRDGQILVEIANRLVKKLNLTQEIVYLYGSRQAWLLPSFTTFGEEQLKRVFPLEHDIDYLSPKVLFARFFISPEEIQSSLEKVGIFPADYNRNLDHSEQKNLYNHILADLSIQELILSKAAEKRNVLLEYLKQVNLLKNNQFGVVDLGTGATLHNALASILETQGLNSLKSFYLGLRKVPDSRHGLPEPYMYDERKDLGFTEVPGLITLLESVCSADHGSVIDYSLQGSEVKPIFREESNQAVIDWGYPIVREAILEFTDHLLLDSSLLNPYADVKAVVEVLQQEFWCHPTVDEAWAWGSFPLEDGWGQEAEFLALASPYSLMDLPRLWWILLRSGDVWLRRHWWHGAALQMSPAWLRMIFRSGERFFKILHRKFFVKH